MHSLTVFLLATILALALAPAPQSQKKSPPEEKKECGTIIPPEQINAELARDAELARKSSAPLAIAPQTDAPYYLPLTIHMVLDSEGIQTGLSPEDLEAVMENLNQMWAPMGIQFFIYGQVDYSILNDNFFNLPNTPSSQDALRKENNVKDTINVYFTNLQGNLGGQGTYTQNSTQGILLDYYAMYGTGVIYGKEIFAHEMGHYFDLYHTHETTFGVECPSKINCMSAGDRMCDTPADPRLNQIGFVDNNCNYTGTAATPAGCDDTAYQPPTRNLMSYARGFCRTEFTSEQISKVLQVLNSAGNRKNLINSWKFYVDPQASSSNTKCTSTAPCRTVEKAVQAAQNGAVIYLKPGVHKTSFLGGKKLTLLRWGNSGVAELRP